MKTIPVKKYSLKSRQKKSKLRLAIILALAPLLLYSGQILCNEKNSTLKQAIKKLPLLNSIQLIEWNKSRYVVSIASIELTENSPMARLKALKTTKAIAQANLSKFINGESIEIREKLCSIRVIDQSGRSQKVVHDKEFFQELIKSESSGILKESGEVYWKNDDKFHFATYVQISE
jgi:ATP/maltotriose-dependent transcriptional regulator MalT